MLKVGNVFKTFTGDVWYVDSVSKSGAYCIHLSAHPAPITTRKKVTKIVNRHFRNAVFSLDSLVDLVDPDKLDQLKLRRRISMARKESTVEPTENATSEAPARPAPKERTVQKFIVSDKTPAKELRGQAKETYDILKGSSDAMSAKDIAAVAVYPNSRQDKERVAAFYLSQFKKDGLVTVVSAPAATEAPAQA